MHGEAGLNCSSPRSSAWRTTDRRLRKAADAACEQGYTAACSPPLRVIGIDDWAWRRNYRYGSIDCNSERRRVVTLLPDREPATAQAWLAAHPTISVIARDRGGGYGEAAARALPHAVQVADRWHLIENASRAFLDAVRKSMRQIRTVIGATTIDPKLLTAAERLQYEGYLRREETNAAILAMSKIGIPIKQIVRQTGHSRKLVRHVIRGDAPTSYEPGRVRWICICHGSMISGRPAVAMGLNFGAA